MYSIINTLNYAVDESTDTVSVVFNVVLMQKKGRGKNGKEIFHI